MSRRKKTSGGQAIVMVSLALFSMAGMMGLAVDLGWSYFTQKVAQASADGAALAAVHEAWARKNGLSSGWACGTGTSASYCQPASPADCSTIQSDTASNLYHGCLYAKNIGFNYSSATAHQNVRIQADVGPALGGSFPPTVTGIVQSNMVYWVTVRSVQTTPQLFSSLLGNTTGPVAAIATAAAVNTILPGSFYGLNREGDCLTDIGKYDCGVDIDVKSAGNATCLDAAGNNTNISAKVCAAGGVFLASSCNGGTTNIAGCTDPGNNAKPNWAGSAQNNATVWGGSSTIVNNSGSVTSDGKTSGDSSWIPQHTNSSNPKFFDDPTHKLTQPPLMANSAIGTCGIQGGNLSATTAYGPFQYYSYTNTDATGKPIPDGKTITVNGNNTVSFSPSGGCPGGFFQSGASAGSFPNYIFYGGLVMNPGGGSGGNNTTINFGAGQYVMAGTLNNTSATSCDGPCVFAAVNNGNLNDTSGGAGAQFIFTDTKYPGAPSQSCYPDCLQTQMQAIPNYNNASSQLQNLVQGDVEIKNVTATLTAPQPATGTTLAPWTNVLFWQDRRNSSDTINTTDGSLISQSGPCTGCNVTATSPRFLMGPGGAALTLTGVLYQPRGAWFELTSGGSKTGGAIKLQLITGALTCGSGGCGSATVQLLSPTAPIIEFVTALIQ